MTSPAKGVVEAQDLRRHYAIGRGLLRGISATAALAVLQLQVLPVLALLLLR